LPGADPTAIVGGLLLRGARLPAEDSCSVNSFVGEGTGALSGSEADVVFTKPHPMYRWSNKAITLDQNAT
jgi:hypothetical protein